MLTVLIFALSLQPVPPAPPVLATASPSAAPAPTVAPSAEPLAAAPVRVGLHPGARANVQISGGVAPLQASASAPLVVATLDPQTNVLSIVAAGQLGSATVRITDATGATLDVPVLVAQDAGTVPASLTLRVTGTPLDPTWLQSQIVAALARSSALQPGASVTVAPIESPSPPAPGASTTVSLPVAIGGNGSALDVNGTTRVTIQNLPVEPFAPPLLFYDDDPEHVGGDGVTYRGTVASGTPSRLYYYHDNALDDPRRLVVALRSATASRVQVIDASAGPNIDVMSVGHAVSRDFLSMKARNQGVVYDLAPNAPLVLHDLAMSRKAGVAGTIGINVLSGGPVGVTVLAVSPGADPLALIDGPLLPRDGHHRTGIFDITNFGTDSLAFAVGSPDAALVYADRTPSPPNVEAGGTGRDYGDYGVVHTMLFSLSNPSAETATVYLYERPIGGIVRSTFVVDGNPVELGCVRLSTQRYQIAAFSLAPQARYQLRVQSMTDGGSNYPIEVGLTTTPPNAATPPISAPDGCFPKPGGGF